MVKICGMKDAGNIREVVKASPQFLGFIFYPKSPRYVKGSLSPEDMKLIPPHIKKVGVFVDEDLDTVIKEVNTYHLDMLQLHGHETPEYCAACREHCKVIKSFHVDGQFNFEQLSNYEPVADYYLFDTKSSLYGGSGKTFNWKLLSEYKSDKPYFLSGGIGMDEIPGITNLDTPPLFAVDLNSKLESEPGIKDPDLTQRVINEIKSLKTYNEQA